MKPDWKALVKQKEKELPSAQRDMEDRVVTYLRDKEKFISKLEKQLFRKVRSQTAGTVEHYDLSEPSFGRPPIFYKSPIRDYCWIIDEHWCRSDVDDILTQVEHRLVEGGVNVARNDKSSASFSISLP